MQAEPNENEQQPDSVRDVGVKLWTLKEADSVVSCLIELQEALMREDTSTYDPSEVFLALQGASLRFAPTTKNSGNTSHEEKQKQFTSPSPFRSDPLHQLQQREDENISNNKLKQANNFSTENHWSILQELIWCVAALARVCVGPAWWHQAVQRRRSVNRGGIGALEADNTINTSNSTNFHAGVIINNHRVRGNGGLHSHLRQTTPTTLPDDSSSTNLENVSTSSVSVQSSAASVGSNHAADYSNSNSQVTHGNPTTADYEANTSATTSLTERSLRLGGRSHTNRHHGSAERSRPIQYPFIPEILPISMLRLAASAVENGCCLMQAGQMSAGIITMELKMNLVEAQLVVIQQLCCAHHTSARYDREHLAWNIPGAHLSVGNILAFSLKLVCTGRSSVSIPHPSLHRNQTQEMEDMLLSFLIQHFQQEITSKSNEQGATSRHGLPNSSTPPAAKAKHASLSAPARDQWKHILLVGRATTDLLSSGWRPLPPSSSSDGTDIVLSLLVIAKRGVMLNDLFASEHNDACTLTESRDERLVASSCAAEALSALVALASRGLIPSRLQDTLVRTICRLHGSLAVTIAAGSSKLLDGNEGQHSSFPASSLLEEEEIEHQIDFFASQRETCLTDTYELLRAMLSHESSVERTMEVMFSIIQTATDTLGAKDTMDSPLFNKLKWNDQTDDFVLSDCATVVRVLSSALWGAAPDFSDIPLLRIFWRDFFSTIFKLLATVHERFVVLSNSAGSQRKPSSVPNLRSNYFSRKVQPLIADSVAALEKAIDAELRAGGGTLTSFDWDVFAEGVERAVVPWLSWLEDNWHPDSPTSACPVSRNQVGLELESFLLRVAELLSACVQSDSFPLIDYASLRKLILLLLHSSRRLDYRNGEITDLAAVQAWCKFGLFPFQLEGWPKTSLEILQEVFARGSDNLRYVHSPAVRHEALELLTFEDGKTNAEALESNSIETLSMLDLSIRLGEVYHEFVAETILPVLREILIEDWSCAKKISEKPCVSDVDRSQAAKSDCSSRSGLNQLSWSGDTAELERYSVELAGRLFMASARDTDHLPELVAMIRSASLYGSSPSVRCDALQQLQSCLENTMSKMPSAHGSIPHLVDSVCTVLESATESMIRSRPNFEDAGVQVNAAVGILGRLRLYSKGRLAMIGSFNGQAAAAQCPTSNDQSEIDAVNVFVNPFIAVDVDDESMKTRFSFERPVNAVMQVLVKSKRKVINDSRAAADMISQIRRTCFLVLRGFLLSGVTIIGASDVANALIDAESDSPTVANDQEAIAMMDAFSAFMQVAATRRVLGLRTNLVLDLFMKCCRSPEISLARRVCQTLSVMISLSESLEDTMAVKDACILTCSLLEGEKGQQLSPAVLVLLEGCICNGWLPPLESMELIKIFDCCLSTVSRTFLLDKSLSLHRATQCAIVVIAAMQSDTFSVVNPMLSAFYDDCMDRLEKNSGSFHFDGCFAPVAIKVALENRIHSVSSNQYIIQISSTARTPASSIHRHLTNECEKVNSFDVESEQDGPHLYCASWLCETNTLLSCRVGSSSSRFQGYVEVTLRSPTTRLRTLVQIPGTTALRDPEFPATLRYAQTSQTHPQERKMGASQKVKLESKLEIEFSDVLDEAEAVLEMFDEAFAEGDEFSPGSNFGSDDEWNQSHASNDESSVSDSSDCRSTLEIQSTSINQDGKDSPMDFHPDPEVVDAFYTDNSPVALPIHESSSRTMRDWFKAVFGWEDDNSGGFDTQLDDHLRRHGLVLGSMGSMCSFMGCTFQQKHPLKYDSKLERAISILDRISPSNTYKFGLLYAGPSSPMNQESDPEKLLLGNLYCSPSFHKFASRLGTLVPTQHLKHFSAGLDVSDFEADGKYALAWSARDATSTIVFHVVNLMPVNSNGRKRHLGNDNVLIIFIEETPDFDKYYQHEHHAAPIVSGQFNFATIFVKHLPPAGIYRVTCRIRSGLPNDLEEALSDFAVDVLLSHDHAVDYTRKLAMDVDLVCRSLVDGLPPPTNCLERCRQIYELNRYAI